MTRIWEVTNEDAVKVKALYRDTVPQPYLLGCWYDKSYEPYPYMFIIE